MVTSRSALGIVDGPQAAAVAGDQDPSLLLVDEEARDGRDRWSSRGASPTTAAVEGGHRFPRTRCRQDPVPFVGSKEIAWAWVPSRPARVAEREPAVRGHERVSWASVVQVPHRRRFPSWCSRRRRRRSCAGGCSGRRRTPLLGVGTSRCRRCTCRAPEPPPIVVTRSLARRCSHR